VWIVALVHEHNVRKSPSTGRRLARQPAKIQHRMA